MELRKRVEQQTGIKVLHVNETADFTDNVEQFTDLLKPMRVHVYICTHCDMDFCINQAFEEQELIKCPCCLQEEHILDNGQGVVQR